MAVSQVDAVQHGAAPANTDGNQSDAIVQMLSQTRAYADRVTSVDVIETHISWVFLTDHYVYKLKKPVKFDFLDFATETARHKACLAEVDLNRRLATDVYLGVVPITRLPRGGFALGGRGPAVDWVVKMARLPESRCLEQLLRRGEVTAVATHRVARMLCDFYDRLPPLPVRTGDYVNGISRHVLANRQELLRPNHELPAAQVRRIHAAQLRFLHVCGATFNSRVLDGRIVEGHGDLRPEHIYLTTPPVAIDCIEFNAEYRRLDVIDELSFLAMECDRLQSGDVGRAIMLEYCRQSGDHPPSQLIEFYKCYRASVRAKVAALAHQQRHEPDDARQQQLAAAYLALADRYAENLGPPLVLVVGGLMGSGKSTLAEMLAENLGVDRLQTDALRRELFGPGKQPAAYGAGIYSEAARNQVYDEMFRRVREKLASGDSVVLDGTFLTNRLRQQAAELARAHGALPLLIQCECPDDVTRERLAARQKSAEHISDGRPELFEAQQRQLEPLAAELSAIKVNTDLPLAMLWERVRQRLSVFCPLINSFQEAT